MTFRPTLKSSSFPRQTWYSQISILLFFIQSNGWYAKSVVSGLTNLNSVFKRNITEKIRHRFPVMDTPDSFRQQRTYIYRLDFRTFFHLIFDRNSVRHNYLKKRNLKKKINFQKPVSLNPWHCNPPFLGRDF